MGLFNRLQLSLQHGWNVFNDPDSIRNYHYSGETSYRRPDRPRFSGGNERSIVTSVYNRIALDAAAIDIKHVKLDDNERYKETIKSGLNNCLTVEANLDQSSRAFKHDIFLSLLNEGCVAIVPTDTTIDPKESESYKIDTMRTGKITQWAPSAVLVELYNEKTGKKKEIWLPKSSTAIVENPFYAVMNEKNSTMQRLIRKLNLLDAIDEQSGAGKLDLIIQLPYSIKTPAREDQANKRLESITKQLSGSKYGIAYADSTEKVTQLNRPVENNLMKQIEYLTSMLYSQLGITQTIMDGSADEKTMLNYYSRTIEPIVTAVIEEMKRKFLTKTARSQLQSIVFFRNPFSLVPVNNLAEIADKFTRNEIMTSNEIRQVIGLTPSKDPKADELRNSNITQPDKQAKSEPTIEETINKEGESQNGDEDL